MGQAFRWVPSGDGSFAGVLGASLFRVRQTARGLEYRVGGATGEREPEVADDLELRRYFREDDDIAAIYADISRDQYLGRLVKKYQGMRLLRQDPWECTVAYLCSANNNIPQISSIVERIAVEFGDRVELDGEARNAFPLPEQVAHDNADNRLFGMKLGLKRAPNIVAVARSVSSGGLDLHALRKEPYDSAKRGIRTLPGVGNKIADCIALFSLDKLEAFPVDVHIGRALSRWPECPLPQGSRGLADRQYAAIVRWAQDNIGPYAGYAGQFLFCDQPKRAVQ